MSSGPERYDLNLEILLEMALEEMNENVSTERAYVSEIMPYLGFKFVGKELSGEAFERTRFEGTIARIRHDALQKDRELQSYFDDLPEKSLENIYVLDLDDSRRHLSRDEVKEVVGYVRSFILNNKLIPLVNIVNELIKIRTAELVSRKILDEQYSGEKGTKWMLNNEPITHKHRPSFLKKCNIISSDLQEDIGDVAEFRNELIHDLQYRAKLKEPEELHSLLEMCIKTIEALDKKLHYPSQVRLYEEKNFEDAVGLDLSQIRSELDSPDFDDAVSEVGDALIKEGIKNEDTFMHRMIDEKLEDDEFLLNSVDRFWNQNLSDIDDETERREMIIRYAWDFQRYFGINIFRKIKENQSRFRSRLPNIVFNPEFIEIFDSMPDE